VRDDLRGIPVPVSLTRSRTCRPSGDSAPPAMDSASTVILLVSMVSVPPPGMASRALTARFTSTCSSRPDVILSDYHLPGFSGEAALAIAQEKYPDVPFIIWSGVLGDEAAVALIKLGATDYVLKDRPARLPSVIGRALAEAEQRMRLADLDEQLREAQRLDRPRCLTYRDRIITIRYIEINEA
jgi:DNA-binding NarL/FixJ family response regulator